jgi:hypothetical protein
MVSSFNRRVCNSVPGTRDSGRVGRGVVVEYFKNFALYGILLATPVWYYEYLASNPLPGPCVGSCTKPLWTLRPTFLLFPVKGGQNGKTFSWQRWLNVFGAKGELLFCTGVLLKDKQKLGLFHSKLNTEFLKYRLWFVRRRLQTSEYYCVWKRVSCVMLQLSAIFTYTGLRLPSCLYHGLPQSDGQYEPTKWYWSVFNKYDSIYTVLFARNPRFSLHYFDCTGSRTHLTSNDWYQFLRSVIKAQW